MTQAQTPEALRLAAICETKGMLPVADELHRMHARILELEQGKCLHQIAEPATNLTRELADMLERSINGLGHYRNTEPWSEADEEHINECNALLERFNSADDEHAAAPQAVQPAVQLIKANCYSDDNGDYWRDCPDDSIFVDGLKVGDTYELQASIRSWSETFRVTKAPDGTSDDYEVELVSSAAPAHPAEGVPALAFKTKVYQALGIGSACDEHMVFVNIENLCRRADCLSAVEREFFMVETPPDEDKGDTEPGEKCLLNWGHTPEQYIKQFAEALAATQPAAQGLDAKAISEWLLARRSHLGSSRESAANWCEHWGAKNWDNYTLLSKHFAAQAKQGGA